MTLLTYIESENGKIKKAGLEVASYGKALADQLNYTTVALVFGVDDATVLHNYGIEKILNVKSSISFEAELFTQYAIFKLDNVVDPVFLIIILGFPQVGLILENFTLFVGDIISTTESSRLWFGAL